MNNNGGIRVLSPSLHSQYRLSELSLSLAHVSLRGDVNSGQDERVQQASLLALISVSLFPAAGSLCPLRDSKCSKRRKMSDVQLLRVSVHERISAAAEDFVLQLEKGGETARVPALRAMLTERLTAAGEEIVAVFEDKMERSEREICSLRRLLEAVMKPELRLHRVGESLEKPLTC
ncbi:unnamed protein product [Pleuronectes platessa]|uniref:Uncharacterized protein n=1 Tax=Pleuronectes platessa TaxID=8262 RepID=A0A9N7UQS6_PLEPL|nr:unnamed protein product [Pleuronectes platessa]